MKIGRRLMIIGCVAVAVLCLSQVVCAYPVQGSIVSRVMQRGREIREAVQERFNAKDRFNGFKEKLSRFASLFSGKDADEQSAYDFVRSILLKKDITLDEGIPGPGTCPLVMFLILLLFTAMAQSTIGIIEKIGELLIRLICMFAPIV